jgi:hypothetical protein
LHLGLWIGAINDPERNFKGMHAAGLIPGIVDGDFASAKLQLLRGPLAPSHNNCSLAEVSARAASIALPPPS